MIQYFVSASLTIVVEAPQSTRAYEVCPVSNKTNMEWEQFYCMIKWFCYDVSKWNFKQISNSIFEVKCIDIVIIYKKIDK